MEKFLELLQPLPAYKYLQVTSKLTQTTNEIDAILQKVEGELHIAYYNSSPSIEETQEYSYTRLQQIKNFKDSFRAPPREYNIIILQELMHLHTNFELLIKASYNALANAGHIIIVQKKDFTQAQNILDLLENLEFRASNSIEISQEYEIIMAKKMHMWGNGL